MVITWAVGNRLLALVVVVALILLVAG